jgi:hypothetical protein
MSGPIIRKYGFPNFEQIFGKETPKHGVEDEIPKAETPGQPPAEGEKPTTPPKPGDVKPPGSPSPS